MSVVIAVLAVIFMGEAVSGDREREILGFGVAVALVVTALAFFLAKTMQRRN